LKLKKDFGDREMGRHMGKKGKVFQIRERSEQASMISAWLKRIGERGPFYKGRFMRYRPRLYCERKIWRNY